MSIAGTDYIYVNYVNSTVTDDAPDNMVLLKMDWEAVIAACILCLMMEYFTG